MKLVLIAEDEYGHAEVLQLLLEAHGYRTAIASNGRDALDLLAGERPAVILSDFMMPHVNGAEFGAAVRADPLLREIPFVFMSATSEDVVRRGFRDYDGFLQKPYEVAVMVDLIEKLANEGRPSAPPRDPEVDASMRHLLKGVKLPPEEA